MGKRAASGEPEGGIPSQGELASLQGALDHLSARQYERVEQLLLERQEAAQRNGQMAMVIILAAASQLCLTCKQLHADRELHKLGLEEATRRERETRRQIRAVLTMLSQLSPPSTEVEEQAAPDLPVPQEKIAFAPHLEQGPTLNLLQRVLRLLRLDKSAETNIAGGGTEIDFKTIAAPSIEPSPLPQASAPASEELGSPSLAVHCLGPFQVYENNEPIEKWPSSKGKSILKYLVINRERPVAKEVLMELFWPEADPDAARNNLNVAIYGLRQALRQEDTTFSHVLYQDEHYLLNPELRIWLDVEEFMTQFQSGQNLQREGKVSEAIREYHAAEALYEGEFLEEDRYEEWPIPLRQRLQSDYLSVLDMLSLYYLDQRDYDSSIIYSRKMLVVDPCREDAHRRLMSNYSRQGQRFLALRQYHYCVEALGRELEVSPSRQTRKLYEQILEIT